MLIVRHICAEQHETEMRQSGESSEQLHCQNNLHLLEFEALGKRSDRTDLNVRQFGYESTVCESLCAFTSQYLYLFRHKGS